MKCPRCKIDLVGYHSTEYHCVEALMVELAKARAHANMLDAHLIERTAERDALRELSVSLAKVIEMRRAGGKQ